MSDDHLPTPAGPRAIDRRPTRPNSPLRGWDGADRLAVEWLRDRVGRPVQDDGPAIWVLNDRFGALAIGALAAGARRVVSLGDSTTAHEALRSNLEANRLDPAAVICVTPLADDVDTITAIAPPSVVVGRFPHGHSLLDHELALLGSHLAPDTPVTLAVMAKHLRRPHVERLTDALGPATVSLAAHKARLVHFTTDGRHLAPAPSAGYVTEATASLPAIRTVGLPGVFGRDRLDPGARVLLRRLPELLAHDVPGDALDLGCGNGVLSAAVGLLCPDVRVTMVDESHLAVDSAAATIRANDLDPDRFATLAADRLDTVADDTVDLVVCNPPFHQDQVVGDEVAWNMFHDARRVLRPTGRLVVVGNRHLGHHTRLKRLFAQVETVSDDPKFVVLTARPGVGK